jgi:hypothetical protein
MDQDLVEVQGLQDHQDRGSAGSSELTGRRYNAGTRYNLDSTVDADPGTGIF